MRPYFSERFGNASSIHHHGQETRAAVEGARDSVAALLGCRSSEIVFTSGGTESDNLAIAGLTAPGDHAITSSVEHHAVLHAVKHLEKIGCEITCLPVDGRGLVDPDDVRRALRPNTKLISIMMANNETGVSCSQSKKSEELRPRPTSLPHRRGSGSGQGSNRCRAHRLRRALHLRPQDPRAAGRGCALRSQGDAPSAAIPWRTPRALAPRRHGKCSRHRWIRESSGTGRARIRARRRPEAGRVA
jgi:hypothetical protein